MSRGKSNEPKVREAADSGVVVLGAGLAGLFAALKLAPRPVTVVAPVQLGQGASSAWAQGGIAAAVGEGDTPEAHAQDTIRAGAGIVDAEIAQLVATEAADRVRDLLAYGVPFDRDLEGQFVLSREAAHSAKRIVRVAGDRAGGAIMQALIQTVRATPSIRVLEGFAAHEIIVVHGRAAGVRLARLDDTAAEYELRPARAVVLATGGIGGLYAVTTNPPHARGDGIAIAARGGAVIADAEFVQFHPTAIDVGLYPAPLATEALRGEGAVLINRAGERFMRSRHPDADLAPRDIVARAVFRQIAAGRGAFLDCRTAIGASFPEAFPTVYGRCRAVGLDPVAQPIPVAPAAHYHMGGVKTDANGRTSVAGLWAVGEVAATGLHGANRLASNSLLEAVVFGARAAADIVRLSPLRGASRAIDLRRQKTTSHIADTGGREAAMRIIRATMSKHVGVEREERGLTTALETLAHIARHASGDRLIENAVLVARFVAEGALWRRESRGGHYRSDYPEPKAEFQRRSSIALPGLERKSGRRANSVLGTGIGRAGVVLR
jgi:L-aspartate oxidase